MPLRSAHLRGLIGLAVKACVLACLWACGEDGNSDDAMPDATLALLSPAAPIGLHYAERSTLSIRYRKNGRPVAGATLSVHIDRDDSGATLSADRLITNDRGDASVLLTAGAAETSFRVVVDAPESPSLLVYVAVSRFDFGNIDALVDATAFDATVLVRVGLVQDTGCAKLPATSLPLPAARTNQASERRATLPFPVLLVKPYGIYARAEDSQGHLVAYGCIELPEAILRTGLRPLVPIPLSPVMPSPLGTFDLDLQLTTKPAAPDPFASLACTYGVAQLLLDGIQDALTPADAELGGRLGAQRSAIDAIGCRIGAGFVDGRVQVPLVATPAGTTLVAISADMASLRGSLLLGSTLSVFAGADRLYQAHHRLRFARFTIPSGNVQYSLDALPFVEARDLSLVQTGLTLVVPPHSLMLGLPSLWRRALDDLVMRPKSIMQTPGQLFAAAVNSAQVGPLTGCAAVEAQICDMLAAPCSGKVAPACVSARDSGENRLTAALSSPAPSYDLALSLMLHLEDKSGMLQAQKVSSGEVSGSVSVTGGVTPITGTASGPRL